MECKQIAVGLWYLFKLSNRFRWVFCQLDILRHCLPPSIRRTLKELPESLDGTYERVLREIKKPNRDLAHRLLQCLVVAIRPLRVEELAEVLAVDFDGGGGTPKLKTSWQWEDHEHALLSSCSSLISIIGNGNHADVDSMVDDDDDSDDSHNHNSRVVQFSHFSVKEFLTSPRLTTPSRDVSRFHIDLEPSHTAMAQACLGELLWSDDSAEGNSISNSSSLAKYAAKHWVAHAQFQSVSSRVRNAMECLFDLDKPYFAIWLRLYDVDMDLRTSPLFLFAPRRELHAGPLYYAALCGFQGLVENLIVKYPHLVNATGGYYMTPALAALARRHLELARMLHRNGSSVDPRGSNGRSPLHSVAHMADSEMVQVLLDCKAEINALSNEDWTPLHMASSNWTPENVKVIRLLLENGADPHALNDDGSTPLHLASHCGIVKAVQLLLKYGADVEAVDGAGRTAFQVASGGGLGHDEITKLLSAHGTKDIL